MLSYQIVEMYMSDPFENVTMSTDKEEIHLKAGNEIYPYDENRASGL